MTLSPAQTVDYIKADRIRLIQRSRRCLLLGWLGLIPLLGVVPACLAIRLHQGLSHETGEAWKPAWLHVVWGGTLLAVFLAGWFWGAVGIGLVLLINVIYQGIRFAHLYRLEQPLAWNPARCQVWFGMILAYSGLGLGILLLELILLISLAGLYKR